MYLKKGFLKTHYFQTDSDLADKKESVTKIEWDYEKLHGYYDSMSMENKQRAKRLRTILDWAKEKDILMVDKKKHQSFSIKSRNGTRLMTFWSKGKVFPFFKEDRYLGGFEERDRFLRDLNELSIFNYNLNSLSAEGKTSAGALEELCDSEFEKFTEIGLTLVC